MPNIWEREDTSVRFFLYRVSQKSRSIGKELAKLQQSQVFISEPELETWIFFMEFERPLLDIKLFF